MKKHSILLVITFFLLALSFSVFNCKDDPTSSDNENPIASIVYPFNNDDFPEGHVLTIIADASDNESVKEVKFYIDGELEFTDNTKPYWYKWDTIGKVGSHTIKVKAYDTSVNECESEVISINVNVVVDNYAPIARFIVSPPWGTTSMIFQFDASGSRDFEDDFYQLPLRFNWDWEDDGTWDVNDSTNYNPSHQFSSAGIYTVKLKVTDSGNLFDEITDTIIVNLPETSTVTDVDGNTYQTVKIGNQWWMAENLKVTHYRNGEVIPNVTDESAWEDLTSGAWCSYNNDNDNAETYGLLYNWFAVDDSRNIAPSGWHVPSDTEWQTLVDYLGGETVAGDKLKESGTNETGFSALPGGGWFVGGAHYGGFEDLGHIATFWFSTKIDEWYAMYWTMERDFFNISRFKAGFSVRCVKD